MFFGDVLTCLSLAPNIEMQLTAATSSLREAGERAEAAAQELARLRRELEER